MDEFQKMLKKREWGNVKRSKKKAIIWEKEVEWKRVRMRT